jgi:ABC-2 type transport system permease protein
VTDLRLALREVGFENRSFWRNPAAAFFTVAFPLFFLVLFSLIFGDAEVEVGGLMVRYSTVLIPAIATFSIVTASYTNVAMNVTFARDYGLLKRIRGTPLPRWAFLFGKIGHATVLNLMLVTTTVIFGALFFDVEVPNETLPAFVLTLAVSTFCFSALGLAVTAAIPNADAAPAVVNFSILPLLFLSNVFIRIDDPAPWIATVRSLFPVFHTMAAMERSFIPGGGGGLEAGHLLVVAAWGVGGVLLAMRFFEWEPRR